MCKWSRKFDACQRCKKSDHPHIAKGLCRPCYDRVRKGPYKQAVAPTCRDGFGRGRRRCCDCKEVKRFGPGPNGEPSEFGVENRLLASGKPMNQGYRHICILCNRKQSREYTRQKRLEQESKGVEAPNVHSEQSEG